MIDFRDVTFIIPVRLESEDRVFNFIQCVKHLCSTLDTNILIYESDTHNKVHNLMQQKIKTIDYKSNITAYFQEGSGAFHRTDYLNYMLSQVNTAIVCNYDCDILLRPETYVAARNKILNEGCDLVYPFRDDSSDAQIQIKIPDKANFTGDLFDPQYHSPWGSKCGHAQFFKTQSYKDGYWENENFVSYAPEDVERMERFIKLGFKVEWLQEHRVLHIEHSRGVNSSAHNPHFEAGQALYNRLHNMSKQELIAYYESQDYLKKYTS